MTASSALSQIHVITTKNSTLFGKVKSLHVKVKFENPYFIVSTDSQYMKNSLLAETRLVNMYLFLSWATSLMFSPSVAVDCLFWKVHSLCSPISPYLSHSFRSQLSSASYRIPSCLHRYADGNESRVALKVWLHRYILTLSLR